MKNLINKLWLLPIIAFLCLGINTHAQTIDLSLTGSSPIAENSGSIQVSATISGATIDADLTVNIQWTGATGDVSGLSDITIPNGSTPGTTVSITVTATNDKVYEGTENVTGTITGYTYSGTGNPTNGTNTAVTFAITDDDIKLEANATNMPETGGSVTLTATAGFTPTSDVTVNLSYGGTATNGTDYTGNATITISSGNTTGTTSISSISDYNMENNETIIAEISSVSDGEISATKTANITILDNDFLTSPANGLTGVSILPKFTWNSPNSGSGTADYTLKISTSATSQTNFNDNVIVTETGISTTSINFTENHSSGKFPLNNNKIYYWQVTPTGGASSDIFQFKTTPSVSISLSNPADQSTGVAASYVIFTWYTGSLNSGLKYYLQIDEDTTTFSSADFSVVTSNIYYTKTNLLENTNYAWRVIAFRDDGDGSFEEDEDVIVSYSASATFKTAGGSTVNAIPSFPTGGAKVYTNTPIFYWYLDSFGSDLSFVVDIDKDKQDNDGATAGFQADQTLSATTNLYAQASSALDPGTTYYWRVTPYYKKGTTNEQVGTPSAWAEFETHGSGTLVVPSVSYPTGGVTVYTTSPYLYWYLGESVSGLTYNVEVDINNTFNSGQKKSYTGVSTLYTQASGLTPGQTYYWRVQSDNGNQSGWSNPVGEFVVAGGLSDGHAVASYPLTNPTLYTNTPTLYWYTEGSTLGLDGFKVKYYKGNSAPTGGWSGYSPTSNDENGGSFTITSMTTLFKQIGPLSYGEKYYWAVAAYDGSNVGTYSEGTFTIVGGTSVIPVLTSPIGGETVSTKSPTLHWYLYGSSTGVTEYEIRYSDNGFLTNYVSKTTSNTYYQLSGLTPGATYSWKVRGKYGSSSTYTSWSATETFVVDPGAAPVQPWVGGPNNVTVPTTSPMVSWVLPAQSESQLTYELEVADNPEFTNSTIITSDQPFTQVDGLNLGNEYYWRARSKTVNGGQYSNYSPTAHFKVDATTSVDERKVIPTEFSVKQNYPNPFNPSTIIEFALPSNQFVSVKIYDILGRNVATLVNKEMNAGVHKITWNGKDNSGAEVSAGAYIYRIAAGKNIVTKKMMLIK